MTTTRLRQVALVARELAPVADELQRLLELGEPYRDPGVTEFGLTNVVFAAGESFIEVLAPLRDGTAGGRQLERRGGDSGYMAIFQVPNMDEARKRIADLGVRVVWQADLPDIAGTHLHPKDVPGAIVSLDWAEPRESWRWAGPAWTGGAPAGVVGGITALTVAARDPLAVAARWAEVLGVAADGALVTLDGGRQTVRFVPAAGEGEEGIVGLTLDLPGVSLPASGVHVGGVLLEGAD